MARDLIDPIDSPANPRSEPAATIISDVPTGPASPPPPSPPVVVINQPAPPVHSTKTRSEIKIYSHSPLLYWWPVWAVGYALGLMTYLGGYQHEVMDGVWMRVHPNQSLGLVFGMTLILVMIITNVRIRGLASVIVILSVMLMTVLFAYLGWWDDIQNWMGRLYLYLDMRFYLTFATVIFAIWAFTVFVVDRMSYWRIKPGQVTHQFVLGSAEKSYDTNNMVLQKHRDDLFRHWVLGLGSGDLEIRTSGAERERIEIPNVLFLGRKIQTIQEMIATEPASFGGAAVK